MLAWVNDDSTLRAYESANVAYAVLRKMLNRSNPPDMEGSAGGGIGRVGQAATVAIDPRG